MVVVFFRKKKNIILYVDVLYKEKIKIKMWLSWKWNDMEILIVRNLWRNWNSNHQQIALEWRSFSFLLALSITRQLMGYIAKWISIFTWVKLQNFYTHAPKTLINKFRYRIILKNSSVQCHCRNFGARNKRWVHSWIGTKCS